MTAPAALEAQYAAAVALHEAATQTGQWWPAEKAYRRIIARHPSVARVQAMLGLLEHQRTERARSTVDPAAMQAAHLGAVLYHEGRLVEADAAYTRALEADPWSTATLTAYGRILAGTCRHEGAVALYARALAADPDDARIWCDAVFIADLTPSTTFAEAQRWRRRFNDALIAPRLAERVPHRNDRDPDRRLRVGYVSADMYQHSGSLTWGGFLVNHDHAQVHVTAYSGTEIEDAVTQKLRAACDRWHVTRGWSDARLAEQIRRDEIDIAVDLAAFTQGGRLLALGSRPAPVQLSGWGYATGLALDCMDAFATDAIVVPETADGQYHERPWRLPSALSWAHPPEDLPVGPLRAAQGRPFTFGVFNRQPKRTREAVHAWVEIVRSVPGSCLLIKNQQLESAQLREIMRTVAIEAGAAYGTGGGAFARECLYVATAGDPSRIIFAGESNHRDQMAAHWNVDVMLDPFPQGGGVSAFEALWMGCPLVTLTDERPPGRIATSLLHQVGLPEWATIDRESYIERAVAASQDIPGLKRIRESLRERVRAMPALALRSYARAVETGYRALWHRYLDATKKTEAA